MNINIHMTDDEIKALANNLGLKWEYKPFVKWRSAYHNRQEPIEVMELCLKIGDHSVKAKEYFEHELKEKLLELLN